MATTIHDKKPAWRAASPPMPPIDLLSAADCATVTALLRAADGLGAADRALRAQFPDLDEVQRWGALRQAQNVVFAGWASNAERKRRERLAREHRGEPQGDEP